MAYHTLLSVHRAVRAGKPKAINKKIQLKSPQNNQIITQRNLSSVKVPKANLTVTRGGFCFRGSTLWNSMPLELRRIEKYTKFKIKLKKWVKKEIMEFIK